VKPASDAGGRLTRTLPGRFYHDPTIWQLEQERLFARLWVCVGNLPDHVIVHTLAPLAPDRSRVTCDWLFAPDAVARPGFDPADTVALFDRVNRQDWEVCEWVQASARSRAFEAGGVYVPIERHIRGFNDWVLEQLGVSVETPDGGGLATPPV
jgi:phenylpropionate dioxygenase-like ring-hydroxylating dioxygenase large terminal subunit